MAHGSRRTLHAARVARALSNPGAELGPPARGGPEARGRQATAPCRGPPCLAHPTRADVLSYHAAQGRLKIGRQTASHAIRKTPRRRPARVSTHDKGQDSCHTDCQGSRAMVDGGGRVGIVDASGGQAADSPVGLDHQALYQRSPAATALRVAAGNRKNISSASTGHAGAAPGMPSGRSASAVGSRGDRGAALGRHGSSEPRRAGKPAARSSVPVASSRSLTIIVDCASPP